MSVKGNMCGIKIQGIKYHMGNSDLNRSNNNELNLFFIFSLTGRLSIHFLAKIKHYQLNLYMIKKY